MRLKQALLEAQKKAVKTRHGTAKDGAVVMYGFNSSLADALDSSDIDGEYVSYHSVLCSSPSHFPGRIPYPRSGVRCYRRELNW